MCSCCVSLQASSPFWGSCEKSRVKGTRKQTLASGELVLRLLACLFPACNTGWFSVQLWLARSDICVFTLTYLINFLRLWHHFNDKRSRKSPLRKELINDLKPVQMRLRFTLITFTLLQAKFSLSIFQTTLSYFRLHTHQEGVSPPAVQAGLPVSRHLN